MVNENKPRKETKELRKFKGYLVEHGIKQTEVAELLGINIRTLSQKLNGKAEFKLSEVRTLCKHYGISAELFL
jgi:transcriptional regulator with XRE-family HTH domain